MPQTSRKRRAMSEINVVPYIDVMLVLLIIFMVTATVQHQGFPVNLPRTEMVESLPLEDIVVNREEEEYWQRVMDQPNLPDELKMHLRETYDLP